MRTYLTTYQKKIFYYALITVGICLAFSSLSTYYVISKIVKNQIEEYVDYTLDNTTNDTNVVFQRLYNLLKTCQEHFFSVSDHIEEPYDLFQKILRQDKYLTELTSRQSLVDSIIIIKPNEYNYFSSMNYNKATLTDTKLDAIRHHLVVIADKQSQQKIFFTRINFEGNNRFVLFLKQVNKEDESSFILFILSDQFIKSISFPNGHTYLVSSKNIVYTGYLSNENIEITNFLKTRNTSKNIGNNRFIYSQRSLLFNNYKLIYIFDAKDVNKEIINLQIQLLVIGIVSFLLCILFSYRISVSIAKPISRLNEQINQVAKNNFVYSNPLIKEYQQQETSIQRKIFVFFFLVSMLPIIASLTTGFFLSQKLIKRNVGLTVEKKIENAFQHVKFTMEVLTNNVTNIIADSSLQNALKDNLNNSSTNLYSSQSDISSLLFNTLVFSEDIANLYILTPDHDLYYKMRYSESPNELFFDNAIKTLKQNPSRKIWSEIYNEELNKTYLQIGSEIRSIDGYGILGYLFIQIRQDNFFRNLKTASNGLDLIWFLNTNNTILQLNGAGQYRDMQSFVDSILQNKKSIIFNDVKYSITYNQFDINNWKLIAAVRDSYLNRDIFFMIFALLLIFGIITFIFAWYLSNTASHNIETLNKQIRNLNINKLEEIEIPQTRNEIQALGISFNNLIKRLQSLINEVYIKKIEIQDSQINALQAQINPHFLYNTLESIQYMIYANNPDSTIMIQLLGDLFRVSIENSTEKFVKFSKEFEHSRLYMKLQKFRYGEKIKFVYNFDKEISELYSLKFLIQPFIENAIQHAFEPKRDHGVIELKSFILQDVLNICIEDNGLGMSREKLKQVNRQLNGEIKSPSFGILNVHKRIKMYFGEPYGVNIDSVENEFTKVQIIHPILSKHP